MLRVLSSIVLYHVMLNFCSAELEKRILLNDLDIQQEFNSMRISIQNLTAKVSSLESKLAAQTQQVQRQQALFALLSTQTGIYQNLTSCPDGFMKHANSCYKFYDQQLSWPAAEKFCESVGAHLIRTETDAEFTFFRNWIISIQSEMTTTGIWIDALQALAKGEWFWAGIMKRISHVNWGTGQPNTGPEQDCIVLWKDHSFYYGDISCNYGGNLVCEIDLATKN